MEETKEITALLHLLDDPDEEVFSAVTSRLICFGRPIIPNLELLWEHTQDGHLQERIEVLIHRLHFTELEAAFKEWADAGGADLLQGAILVARYQYPDLDEKPIYNEVERIRRSIWLELNSYLTTLEQINVISKILYSHHGLKGMELSYDQPDHFFIHKVLESKKGNGISNGILYRILSESLDIPIRVINIPKQFVLAFFDVNFETEALKKNPSLAIDLYIDPVSGHAFTYNNIAQYFQRINVPPTASYFKPLSNKRIIQLMLEELAKCYTQPGEEYKQQELNQLSGLLNN